MKKHLGRLRERFSFLPVHYRFSLIFALLLFLAFSIAGSLAKPYGTHGRAMICQFIARAVQAQGGKALLGGNNYLNSLREDLAYLGWEVWITDESGNILSSSFSHPLPIDWSLLPRPVDEFELGWGPPVESPSPNLAVMRLVSSPVRFMVFYSDYSKNFEGKVVFGVLAAFLFIVIMAHLVLTFVTGGLTPRLKSQAGFTLLETVIVIVLLSISLFIFLQFMKVSTRSTSHTNVKLAITSLSDTIRNGVDCAQTIAKNTFSTPANCQPGAYKALELYDSRGVRLGTPMVPVSSGVLDPLSGNNTGSSQIGNWSVRAYCDSATDSLVVRFARFGNAGAFYADPLLKRPYDWKDSPDNPLFGTADRQLCKGIASGTPGGGARQIVVANFGLAPLAQRNCTSSFDKNGKTYLIAIGAPEYVLLIPDSTRIVANVQCPAGMKVISGGAECGTGLSTGSAVAPGDPSGNISSSYPSADGTGWNVMCCVEGTPRGDARAYALCSAQ